jgi:hypothetical protein
VDLRERPPHLRPWRDGWRHLRYLLMLSPTWLFGIPALLAMSLATVIFGTASLFALGLLQGVSFFGTSWTIVAGYLFTVGHFCLIMALATYSYGVGRGYRRLYPWLARVGQKVTLEAVLIAGTSMVAMSLAALTAITVQWSSHGFTALPSILPLTIAATFGAVGLQTALGGFLLAIIADNNARLTPLEINDVIPRATVQS